MRYSAVVVTVVLICVGSLRGYSSVLIVWVFVVVTSHHNHLRNHQVWV